MPKRLRLADVRSPDTSRLVAIRLALHTLRMMEHWRSVWGDIDRALIVLGVSAVLAERLTRMTLPPELQDLNQKLPEERLARLGVCKLSSIAAATGLNRETTRRKVNQMIQEGILTRKQDGSIQFADGVGQRDDVREMIKQQTHTVIRTANELIDDGAVEVVENESP